MAALSPRPHWGNPPPSTTRAAEYLYIHVDHLNTPQIVSDQNQQVVWKADYKPFGEVDETVSTIEMNLRFPGQYEDAETRLNYNYCRSYDAATGRYTQSDPIGVEGGLNIFNYSNAMSGLAYFALRPLEGMHGRPTCGRTLGGRLNLQLAHEQLFFEDGEEPSNLGLFDDSQVRPDRPQNLPKYVCKRGGYDDCVMREAVKRVAGGRYCLLGKPGMKKNNCQDWAEKVRAEYRRLENDSEIIQRCKCS